MEKERVFMRPLQVLFDEVFVGAFSAIWGGAGAISGETAGVSEVE
jgi:hypothetical protein